MPRRATFPSSQAALRQRFPLFTSGVDDYIDHALGYDADPEEE